MIKLSKLSSALFVLLLAVFPAPAVEAQDKAQTPRRQLHIFLDLKEKNLDQPSSVAANTLAERLTVAGFRVTTKRREATLVIEGVVNSRLTPVTEEVKREGGVNAEASAAVRLMAGNDVISTSVQRSAPGDWGVQAERVGEDRLIEVAELVAKDLFDGEFVQELIDEARPPLRQTTPVKPAPKQAAKPPVKRRLGILEVVGLMRNHTPEDRIVTALRKYGIKFDPRDPAFNQLRSEGASETLISAIKTLKVV
jgi:hypothetical protein